MEMDEMFRQVALLYGVSVEEVKRDMQEAINAYLCEPEHPGAEGSAHRGNPRH